MNFPFIPQSIQKRLIKFLLKRTIGPLMQYELDLDQLEVELGNGRVQLTDLHMSPAALNSFLPPSFPLRLSEGTISSIAVSIPWMNIWSQDCEMQIDAVHLVGYIVGNESLYRHDDQESKWHIFVEAYILLWW
eukprot:Partr_v1_DN28907_c2_g1_i7_m25882 putative Autophagy related